MEDRETPVLYLEMTEATPDDYARDRVEDVLALPGVERATWWRNVYRDRPDLPRELAEFDTLGVYECDPSFAAPPTPATRRYVLSCSSAHFPRGRRARLATVQYRGGRPGFA
jgi:hypothetical protein